MNFRTIRYLSRIISIGGVLVLSSFIGSDMLFGTGVSIFKILNAEEFMALYMGLLISGIVFEMVMDRREFRKASSIIKGKPVYNGVVSEEFNLKKTKNSVLVKYKTKVRIGFEVERPMFDWDISVKKGNAPAKAIETKRINDWLRDMKAKGYGINSVHQDGSDVRIYLNLGGFDGPRFVDFARDARAFLGLEVPTTFGPEPVGEVKKRNLNPAEKDMELRTYNKDWGGMKYIVIGLLIPTFVGIGMILLSPMLSWFGWILSFVCGIIALVMGLGWYLHIKFIKEIEAGVLCVTSERITWVFSAAKKMDDDEEGLKNRVIIGGEEIIFPDEAPFNYKIGDKAMVERYPSGRVYKVDGIRIDTF